MDQAEGGSGFVAGSGVTLLCFASGATDVLSYLTLGHIFTSAMTGCMALLFVAIVAGKRGAAIRAALSLLSYVAGGAVATLLQPGDPDKVQARPVIRRLLVAELVILGLYGVGAALAGHVIAVDVRYGLIFLSALAMGIQAVTARDIHERGIITVVLNITITSVVVALTRRLTHRGLDRLPWHNRLQAIVIVGYALGAAGSGVALVSGVVSPAVLPFAAVLVTLGLFTLSPRKMA